jgi:hypothetical protein
MTRVPAALRPTPIAVTSELNAAPTSSTQCPPVPSSGVAVEKMPPVPVACPWGELPTYTRDGPSVADMSKATASPTEPRRAAGSDRMTLLPLSLDQTPT